MIFFILVRPLYHMDGTMYYFMYLEYWKGCQKICQLTKLNDEDPYPTRCALFQQSLYWMLWRVASTRNWEMGSINPWSWESSVCYRVSYTNILRRFLQRDELVGLLEIVYNYTEAVQIFSLLGLTDKVPEFIGRLVKKGLHLDAIKYVCAFEPGVNFPPATLLSGYINYKQEDARKVCEEGKYSIKSWDCAIEKLLKAFRAAIKCIRLHKLESQYPLDDLEARTEQYELLCINQGSSVTSTLCKTETSRKRKWLVPEHTIHAETGKEEELDGEKRRAQSL